MSVLNDIKELLLSLRLVDVIFFLAVLVLMILVITLIYFIRINKDEEIIEDEKLNETAEMKIARELEKNMKNSDDMVKFTDYEKEQEDKAIISYDELLNKNKGSSLNYEMEEHQDDLTVKKIDLDNIVKEDDSALPKLEVRVISFEREEAFLEALKTLEKGLG